MQPSHSPGHAIIRAMRPEDRDAVIRILADSDPWKRLGFTAERLGQDFRADAARKGHVRPGGRGSRAAGIAIVRKKFLFGDYLELLGIAPSAHRPGARETAARLISNRSPSHGPKTCSPACRILMTAPAPSTANKATRKSVPCRIFSFLAMPRFCSARRPDRQERSEVRLIDRLHRCLGWRLTNRSFTECSQHFHQGRKERGPRAYAGRVR